MGRRNNKDDSGLLIWGIILLFTGIGSGLGAILISIYVLKKIFKGGRFFEDAISYNIKKKIEQENKYKTYTDNTGAKVIYAEKVENVKKDYSANYNTSANKESTATSQNIKVSNEFEYSIQDILDKLEYYKEKTDLTNDEIMEKITILNKMLASLSKRIEKVELQNDISDINKIIDKTLKTLKKKKSKIKNVHNFTTYYLPVTLEILIKYDEVENLKLGSSDSLEFMSTVEEKIKMIKGSFEKQLESLYTDDFDNVEAELNVLETMLKSEGYTDIDDFNLRKNGKK